MRRPHEGLTGRSMPARPSALHGGRGPPCRNPSMRQKIVHHLGDGGEGLDPLVREAVQRLGVKQADEAGYSG
jgi:hypothetical protein